MLSRALAGALVSQAPAQKEGNEIRFFDRSVRYRAKRSACSVHGKGNDEEVKANPEMLTKSRLLKLLIKKQYVKLREVTEEEQPADLAELLEELDENNRLVVFRLLKKDVETEALASMFDAARSALVNASSDV